MTSVSALAKNFMITAGLFCAAIGGYIIVKPSPKPVAHVQIKQNPENEALYRLEIALLDDQDRRLRRVCDDPENKRLMRHNADFFRDCADMRQQLDATRKVVEGTHSVPLEEQ
jgi:hypothetical protein